MELTRGDQKGELGLVGFEPFDLRIGTYSRRDASCSNCMNLHQFWEFMRFVLADIALEQPVKRSSSSTTDTDGIAPVGSGGFFVRGIQPLEPKSFG